MTTTEISWLQGMGKSCDFLGVFFDKNPGLLVFFGRDHSIFGKINVLMLLNVADDFDGFPENN